MFNGDDDDLVFYIQLTEKVRFIHKILHHCKTQMDKAEKFVGNPSGFNWNGNSVYLDDFSEIFEFIAAGFRYQFGAKQNDFFKEPITPTYILKEWTSWFEIFLQIHFADDWAVQKVLLLAQASTDILKFREDTKKNASNEEIKHLQSEIIDHIRYVIPEEIYKRTHSKKKLQKNPSKKTRKFVWRCACTKINKKPCYTHPCLTEAKRSAEKGIILD